MDDQTSSTISSGDTNNLSSPPNVTDVSSDVVNQSVGDQTAQPIPSSAPAPAQPPQPDLGPPAQLTQVDHEIATFVGPGFQNAQPIQPPTVEPTIEPPLTPLDADVDQTEPAQPVGEPAIQPVENLTYETIYPPSAQPAPVPEPLPDITPAASLQSGKKTFIIIAVVASVLIATAATAYIFLRKPKPKPTTTNNNPEVVGTDNQLSQSGDQVSPDILARDSQRKNDLKTIKDTLEKYYTDNTEYPPDLVTLTRGSKPYLKTLPTDPTKKADYDYRSVKTGKNNSITSYSLSATLENKNDKDERDGVYTVNSTN